MTETYAKEGVAWRTMVKVRLSNSFPERRDGRQKFSESLGAGASRGGEAPRQCQQISLGSVKTGKDSLFRKCNNWPTRKTRLAIDRDVRSRQGQDWHWRSGHATSLRSHFVIRPRRAPEWLRARFFWVVSLANEELTGKTLTTFLNTTNPNKCEI